MNKLRRHDWRSHREIQCNICEEQIESRQAIKNHRQTRHKIFKKAYCRFYPSCVDEEECIFEHEEIIGYEAPSKFCPNGQKCSDQACMYSEANHKNANEMNCVFQEKCNRKCCDLKHSAPRKAFLGESTHFKRSP